MSEEQNSTSDIYIEDQEDSKSIETSQVHNVLNNSIPNEVDSHTVEDVTEIELPKENGEQNNTKEDKLLTTNFEVKAENRKVEGPITYSTDQQINRYSNSTSILQLTKKYGKFILILNQKSKQMDNPWHFTTYGFLCNNRKSKSDDEGKS